MGRGLGVKELEGYEPPSVVLADDLEKAGEKPLKATTGEERQLDVLRFIAETGGG